WVWEQSCEGKLADFNERYDITLDPKFSPDGWTNDRKLSSKFLETILLHEPFRSALTRNGVRIIGAWFRESVDLANAKLEHQLWLDNSRFDSSVDISGLKGASHLSLEGSTFTGTLDMDSMEVGGDLFMRGGAEFSDVNLLNARIGFSLEMDGSTFTGTTQVGSRHVIGSVTPRRNGAANPNIPQPVAITLNPGAGTRSAATTDSGSGGRNAPPQDDSDNR
ncbi:MAG: hypothetical protein IH848_05140, partial [Acidobacteria bacterium]|nr:hypothetical protein [Acidobacteriota bacterium]